jgi:hypothetical protein
LSATFVAQIAALDAESHRIRRQSECSNALSGGRKMRWPEKEKQIDAIHRAGSVAFVVQRAKPAYWR